MPQEDYLLKYIEKLSQVIAAMLGFRQNGLTDDALRLADETYTELLDTNLKNILSMPISEFKNKLQISNFNPSIIDALAKISFETTQTYRLRGDFSNMQKFREKALFLYCLLNETDKTFSFEREELINKLKSEFN